MFLFTATATTEIYTLSLHDALPISGSRIPAHRPRRRGRFLQVPFRSDPNARCRRRIHLSTSERDLKESDRKSTRLNSSHRCISYAVFCLKKKKKKNNKVYNADKKDN